MEERTLEINKKYSYFQVINEETKTNLKLVRGETPLVVTEVADYLTQHKISFNLTELNKAVISVRDELIIELCKQKSFPIREEFILNVSENKMQAIGRFYPPSNDGGYMDKKEILADLRYKGIVFGVDEQIVDDFLSERSYCNNIILASGQEPRHGSDAWIEYLFNTDVKARPTLQEDGSVDFFHLNIINHVKKGDCLAVLHPEDLGDDGRDVYGNVIKPRSVKRELLKFGRNIDLAENRREIYSQVDGHVNLVEGKVFVSDVMVVENVDISTGDIDYEGNVQVNGNVCSNYKVSARGNVEVRGVVEGAEITAGGNVTIARGVNGMSKGVIKAGGNIIAQFVENAKIEAQGYVETGSILHSNVSAGTEIRVGGKKGFITGGYVCATNLIEVKTLGAELGANTIVEIGINPDTKRRYHALEEQIKADTKTINTAQPVLDAAKAKILSGIKLPPEQVKNIQDLSNVVTLKKKGIEAAVKEMEQLEEIMNISNEAQIIVKDRVYPGTKIVISDVSRIMKTQAQYCRFIKSKGDVAIVGMI